MDDARAESERLPWLDSPRHPATAPAKKPSPKAARRARGPIFALLSLFVIAGVGMIAYLAGRGSVGVWEADTPAPPPAVAPQATVTLPPPPPPLPPEIVTSEVRVADAPSPPPAAKSTASAEKRTTNVATRPRSARQAKAAPSARAIRARRAIRQMPPLVKASPVVQLGVYRTRGQAGAAFRRVAKVYPYLKKLPRGVDPITLSDNSRLYRLRLREYSPEYARILCTNLRSIGRGCTVLPAA